MGEWYYIGHYGQLGPLSVDQLNELIQGGVIVRETYVWRQGMTDWVRADMVTELHAMLSVVSPMAPPPPPVGQSMISPAPTYAQDMGNVAPVRYQPNQYPTFNPIKSDRSKTVGGVLQLLVPGIGRMYMGYFAYGILQLVLTPCGVGWIWSIIDGIVILTGGVKIDGYGRQLGE